MEQQRKTLITAAASPFLINPIQRGMCRYSDVEKFWSLLAAEVTGRCVVGVPVSSRCGRPSGSLSSHVVCACERGAMVSEELLPRFPFHLSRGFTQFKSVLVNQHVRLFNLFIFLCKATSSAHKRNGCSATLGTPLITWVKELLCCSVRKEVMKISFPPADKAVNSRPHLILHFLLCYLFERTYFQACRQVYLSGRIVHTEKLLL